MRWLLLAVVACVTPEERGRRQAYYQTHPMAECRYLLAMADAGRVARNVSAIANGTPQETGPFNPCALGCRIPVCGYPPAPSESP
jgi:hypothetical protein